MKDFCLSLVLVFAIFMSAQVSYAAWEGFQSLNPMPQISYLNPLPYVGIGENKTNFSLNPFAGFKNCNKCKVKRVAYCNNEKMDTCGCKKSITKQKCDTCHRKIEEVVIPKCSSCGRK